MVEVTQVSENSPAQRAGVLPGDCLISIDGHDIRDVLDYRFFSAECHLSLLVHRGPELLTLSLDKEEYEDPGMEFATPLMDEKHSCRNKCIFCFIDQLPKGMRKSLYFKDDDTRLSFLHGNYVTLTNLTDADVDRIIEMHISPVNISVHTTDPELRVKMMRNKRAGEVLQYLRRFADAGLSMQAQIVLCRSVNDGEHLTRTLRDLATCYPSMDSVSVVPVGLSDHREGLYPLEPFSREDAAAVLMQVNGLGDEFLRKLGTRFVYCSDEWYLKAEKPLPPEDYYEGYPQLDNGVGMLRSLMEETHVFFEEHPHLRCRRRTVSVATGTAAAPTISCIAKELCARCPELTVYVYPIENDWFGHAITVSGLLTGRDIVAQLSGKPLGDELLLPPNALRAGEEILLGDMTVSDISRALGVPVRAAGEDGAQLLMALLGGDHHRHHLRRG